MLQNCVSGIKLQIHILTHSVVRTQKWFDMCHTLHINKNDLFRSPTQTFFLLRFLTLWFVLTFNSWIFFPYKERITGQKLGYLMPQSNHYSFISCMWENYVLVVLGLLICVTLCPTDNVFVGYNAPR